MKYSFFILFLVVFFGFSAVAYAQLNQPMETTINIDLSPENPGPNQYVYAALTSYATNIDAATITWKLNGKTVQSGKGVKSYSFTTGGIGKTTTLEIIAQTQEGETIDKSVTIKPASVDLIWQSDAFVPPFYKGKALYSWQNQITFIALPHIMSSSGAEISPKSLIYKWTQNGSVDAANSGYGRNTFTVIPNIISRPLDISVEVSSPNNDSTGIAETVAAPADASVILYKKSPLYGIQFESALQNTVALSDSKEIVVIAEPFYFGVFDPASPTLSYTWAVNGAHIQNSSGRTQVFRQPAGVSGISNISLTLENSDKVLQAADSSFSLKF